MSDIIKIIVSPLTPPVIKVVVNERSVTKLPSTEEDITAYAGGGQADATLISSEFNIIEIVSTEVDSCKLDAAIAGKARNIFNAGDNGCEIFPAEGERFKNGGTLLDVDEPVSLAAGNGIQLVCYSDGIWRFY